MSDNNLTPAEVLRRAADHMERVGMHKGTFFKFPQGCNPADEQLYLSIVPCCARGAIKVITRGLDRGGALEAAAHNCLDKQVPQTDPGHEPIATFNDHPDTTLEMMVGLMRKAAAECTCLDAPTSRDADAGGK